MTKTTRILLIGFMCIAGVAVASSCASRCSTDQDCAGQQLGDRCEQSFCVPGEAAAGPSDGGR